jgi:hypothetical protein
MLSPTVPSVFFFSVLWLVWVVVGIATLVVFYRGMTALAKIPDRLERIEQALATHRSAFDDRAT